MATNLDHRTLVDEYESFLNQTVSISL